MQTNMTVNTTTFTHLGLPDSIPLYQVQERRHGEDNISSVHQDTSPSENLTWDEMCEEAEVPTAYDLFHGADYVGTILILVFGLLLFGITLVVYIEVIVFILKHFKVRKRKARTIWIISVYPIYSCCGLLAVLIPRAATIIDLVTDVFLSTCVYQFMGLLFDYTGGMKHAWRTMKDTSVSMRSAPLCCCCFCLPQVKLTRARFNSFTAMVLQLIISRPILSFIAAVMWADGVYVPGHIAWDNAYVYIASLNLAASCLAVWGMTLIRRAFQPLLESHIPGKKFMPLQCLMLLTIVPNLLINMLVNRGVIPCLEVLPSKARGDRIYHGWLVILMIPLSLVSRHFYRRYIDGGYTNKVSDETKENHDRTNGGSSAHSNGFSGLYPALGSSNSSYVNYRADAENFCTKCKEFQTMNHVTWSTYL